MPAIARVDICGDLAQYGVVHVSAIVGGICVLFRCTLPLLCSVCARARPIARGRVCACGIA
jgi:hypothetical protein